MDKMIQKKFSTWVHIANSPEPPYAAVLARDFTTDAGELEFVYSADERCVLFLDGIRLDAGPEYGDSFGWFCRRIKSHLFCGTHRLLVRLFFYGTEAAKPRAQVSIKPGFYLDSVTHPEISTKQPGWRGKALDGVEFVNPGPAWGTGAKQKIEGHSFPWQAFNGMEELSSWAMAQPFQDGRTLLESTLPPMNYNLLPFPAVRSGSSVLGQIGEHQHKRWILDYENYECVYYRLKFRGGSGAKIRLHWAETLFDKYAWTQDDGGPMKKGNRNQIIHKEFHGTGDEILAGGDPAIVCIYESFWWYAGRYLELQVDTAETPLELIDLEFFSTGYPLKKEYKACCSDPRLERLNEQCFATLAACSHDIFCDCPYYEQLMYIGDVWVESSILSVVTHDTCLQRHALRLLGQSQRYNKNGCLHSRWPSWDVQIIPIYMLHYIMLVYDYALWRDDAALVKELLPICRKAMVNLLQQITPEGLLKPDGWNFIDWISSDGWENGTPPDSDNHPNAITNLLCVVALERLSVLENYVGESSRGSEWEKCAKKGVVLADRYFWDSKRGIYANDSKHLYFSEHAQIVALQSRNIPEFRKEQLTDALQNHRCGPEPGSSCFAHLFFEMAATRNLTEELFRRMSYWYRFDADGLKTIPENFINPRSDCHAWSAHPLHHFFTALLGIRPASFGFKRILLAPHIGSLKSLSGTMPHPQGQIRVTIKSQDSGYVLSYNSPEGVPISLEWNGKHQTLAEGQGEVFLEKIAVNKTLVTT